MITHTDRCEVCGSTEVVGVRALPYMPFSIAWCQKCLDARVIPFWAAVGNTANIRGMSNANDDWKALVARTLVYLNRTQQEFDSEVNELLDSMGEFDEDNDDAPPVMDDHRDWHRSERYHDDDDDTRI